MVRSKAFTLTEMMVVLAIFMVMIAAVFGVLSMARNSWFSGAAYVDIQQELRKVEEAITRELPQGRNSTLSIPSFNRIDFDMPTAVAEGGGITWQRVTYMHDPDPRRVLRIVGNDVKIIANNITALRFTQVSTGGAPVPRLYNTMVASSKTDLTGRVRNYTSAFEVKLRN